MELIENFICLSIEFAESFALILRAAEPASGGSPWLEAFDPGGIQRLKFADAPPLETALGSKT